jgi:protein-disulfide isomerase
MMEQPMKRTNLVSGAILAGVISLAPHASPAQDLRGEIEAIVKDYLAAHPEEVGQIAKDYFVKHPEAVGQILAELLKHRSGATASASAPTTPSASANAAGERSTAINSNASQLFSSPHQVTLGNPQGDVTLVEFFDYSCGYCKRALPDMLALLKDDPKLKIVLKEFPILGPGSADAARVAIAVRMQDTDGQKYLAFHQELLGGPGPASKEKALAAAKDQGLDMDRLQQDMASDEVNATLSEDMKLAGAIGITGTPGYVIGKDLVLGAIGVMGLKGQIQTARDMGAH